MVGRVRKQSFSLGERTCPNTKNTHVVEEGESRAKKKHEHQKERTNQTLHASFSTENRHQIKHGYATCVPERQTMGRHNVASMRARRAPARNDLPQPSSAFLQRLKRVSPSCAQARSLAYRKAAEVHFEALGIGFPPVEREVGASRLVLYMMFLHVRV